MGLQLPSGGTQDGDSERRTGAVRSPLAPIERLVAGLIVIVAAAGHLALLAAAVVYFYALLLPVL